MNRRSVRARVTAIASVVAALVLAAAGTGLVLLQRSTMIDTLDRALETRADDLEALLAAGEPPAQFAAVGDEGFVQLVATDGSVVAATPNLEGDDPLALSVEPVGDTVQVASDLPADDDVFRVLSRPVAEGVLHVGTTFDVVNESTAALAGSLAVLIPIILIVLGVLEWWLVGRTLSPVEDIRAEVAAIGSTELDRRVTRPGTEDEIERLAETMNSMLDRLQESVEKQGRLIADASHELKSPITRLRAELELGLKETEDPPERARLVSLLDEVLQMQSSVDDLLFLARLDSDRPPPVASRVDLDDIVLQETRHISAGGHVVDLSAVSGAHVITDRALVRRAVANLVDNAGKHARELITVALEESDGWAVLTVEDDGPGIPHEAATRVFERFGRADEARSHATGGTGLGLAISREIAQTVGGSLVLVNPGEPGARFELKIPLSPS